MVEDLVSSRSYVSAGHSGEGVGFGSYQVRYKGNFHSPGEWRHLVRYQVAQSGIGGISIKGGLFISFLVRCELKPLWRGWRTCFLPGQI